MEALHGACKFGAGCAPNSREFCCRIACFRRKTHTGGCKKLRAFGASHAKFYSNTRDKLTRALHFDSRAALAHLAPNGHQTRAVFGFEWRVFAAKRAPTAAKTCASAARVTQKFRDARRARCISFCVQHLQIWRRMCSKLVQFSASDCAFSPQNAHRALQKLARVRHE